MKADERERLDMQCMVIKREIYQLKKLLDACTHEEQRADATRRVMDAYYVFDNVQEFIKTR